MTLHIRDAATGDVALILKLIKALAEYEKLLHEVVATEEMLREALFSPNAKAFCLIAEDAGKPVGFALYFFNFSTFLGRHGVYLEDLFVLPEARGAGAGKAILARLAQIALDNDCGRLEWSVLDWNEPAIKFYKSLGAVSMDEWTVNRVTGDALQSLAKSPAKAGST